MYTGIFQGHREVRRCDACENSNAYAIKVCCKIKRILYIMVTVIQIEMVIFLNSCANTYDSFA